MFRNFPVVSNLFRHGVTFLQPLPASDSAMRHSVQMFSSPRPSPAPAGLFSCVPDRFALFFKCSYTRLALLREASEAMRLSARGYHRVLRVARTLADLDGEELVRRVHFAEALAYRALTDELRRAA